MGNLEGFDKTDFRLGLVSYTSFNHNKPPKYLTDFVKCLDFISNEFFNQNLVCCVGGNNWGFEYWFNLFYPRMINNQPTVFGYNNDENISPRERKLEMYMNLVDYVDSVIYLTHSNSKKNDFGYFIQDKCTIQNKPYNEVKVRLLNKDMDTCMNECVQMVEKMKS